MTRTVRRLPLSIEENKKALMTMMGLPWNLTEGAVVKAKAKRRFEVAPVPLAAPPAAPEVAPPTEQPSAAPQAGMIAAAAAAAPAEAAASAPTVAAQAAAPTALAAAQKRARAMQEILKDNVNLVFGPNSVEADTAAPAASAGEEPAEQRAPDAAIEEGDGEDDKENLEYDLEDGEEITEDELKEATDKKANVNEGL